MNQRTQVMSKLEGAANRKLAHHGKFKDEAIYDPHEGDTKGSRHGQNTVGAANRKHVHHHIFKDEAYLTHIKRHVGLKLYLKTRRGG